jgi:hypothetical protein
VFSSGQSYNFNINTKPNDLNIKSLLPTKQLEAEYLWNTDFLHPGTALLIIYIPVVHLASIYFNPLAELA